MARPTQVEAIANKMRDNEILKKAEDGYPLDYLALFYKLTKGRIVQIIKRKKDEREKAERQKKMVDIAKNEVATN